MKEYFETKYFLETTLNGVSRIVVESEQGFTFNFEDSMLIVIQGISKQMRETLRCVFLLYKRCVNNQPLGR